MSRPTPETDAATLWAYHHSNFGGKEKIAAFVEPTEQGSLVYSDFARNLERQRDDLREQLRTQASEHSLANRRLEDEIGRLQVASSHNEGILNRLLDGALIPHDVAGGELLNAAQRLELLIGKLSSMRDALDMVKRKWTFNNNQHHTHTWHDWADCVAVIEQALSPSPPAVAPNDFTAELESKLASMSDTELTNAMLRAGFEPEPPAVERVIICPECYQPCTQDHNSFKCDFCQKLWPKGYGHETYELPDDAPVEVERWAKERAHFAKGGRVQSKINPGAGGQSIGAGWFIDHSPTWDDDRLYRIAPDDTASKCPECGTNHGCLCDDAPPVQTEEKA